MPDLGYIPPIHSGAKNPFNSHFKIGNETRTRRMFQHKDSPENFVLPRLAASVIAQGIRDGDLPWLMSDQSYTIPGTFRFWCWAAGRSGDDQVREARRRVLLKWKENPRRYGRVLTMADVEEALTRLERGEGFFPVFEEDAPDDRPPPDGLPSSGIPKAADPTP